MLNLPQGKMDADEMRLYSIFQNLIQGNQEMDVDEMCLYSIFEIPASDYDLDEKKKVALSVIAQLKTKMAKYVHSLNIIVLKLHHFWIIKTFSNQKMLQYEHWIKIIHISSFEISI